MKYSITKKAYQSLKNKIICIYSFLCILLTFIYGIFIYGMFSGMITLGENIDIFFPILLGTILFIIFQIGCTYSFIKTYKRLIDVYRAKKQYIQVNEDTITMLLYDDIQNKNTDYHREEPIYQGIHILNIHSIKKNLFSYKIHGDFEETFIRRNPFTVQKRNKEFIIYRMFENDREIQNILLQRLKR